MDNETLEALKGSIAKWEGIAAGTEFDQGCSNCPLCQKFAIGVSNRCLGCPVHEVTGLTNCEGSPYDNVPYRTDFNDEDLYLSILKTAAQAELDFLKSLLPTP